MKRRTREPTAPDEQDDLASAALTEPRASMSKSAVKRELAAVQSLAKRLLTLPDRLLSVLGLSEETRDALATARTLERRAKQRQLRYVSGLLAQEDYPAVRHALERITRPEVEDVRRFHQVEQWRDALLGGDSALVGDLATRFPALDRQRLSQLVREAQRERREERPPRASRQLFRFLSDLVRAD